MTGRSVAVDRGAQPNAVKAEPISTARSSRRVHQVIPWKTSGVGAVIDHAAERDVDVGVHLQIFAAGLADLGLDGRQLFESSSRGRDEHEIGAAGGEFVDSRGYVPSAATTGCGGLGVGGPEICRRFSTASLLRRPRRFPAKEESPSDCPGRRRRAEQLPRSCRGATDPGPATRHGRARWHQVWQWLWARGCSLVCVVVATGISPRWRVRGATRAAKQDRVRPPCRPARA